MRRPKLIPLLYGLAMATLVACGESAPMATTAASDETTAAGTLHAWLPSFTANSLDAKRSSCNIQLDVQLSLSGERIDGAVLSDQVEGACDALVLENKRFYEMRLVGETCGTKTYEGTLATSRGTSQLRIVDQSQRTCGVAGPHAVELTERHANGKPRRFGGSW